MKWISKLFRASPRWEETVFWALDLETEGLDPRRDAILSVGMVPVRGGIIRLSESFTSLIRTSNNPLPDLGAIGAHHLRPVDTARAPTLAEVLPEILDRVEGHVLLLHHAPIDIGFLRRGLSDLGLKWKQPPVVDTVRLLYKRADQQRFLGGMTEDPELNLFAARQLLGLPAYPPHDALTDAVATAELFLLLCARLGIRRLGQLV
jgi:DNA polymerase-3 subunit epsilon